jgi:hypothetical protein
MKHVVVMGAFVAALAVTVGAQAPPKSQPAKGGAAAQGGHTVPNTQPATAPAPTAPAGELALGSVHLAKKVTADGKPLAAGTYQVRLTAQAAAPDAKGQTKELERWVEFVQGGQVKGREVVTIIPQSEIDKVQKDRPPAANSAKVEVLKGGDYVRVWVRKGANNYLIHLPTA